MSESELAEQGPERAISGREAALAAGEISFTGSSQAARIPPPARALRSHGVGALQRSLGNRGVQRLLTGPSVQRDTPKPGAAPAASPVPATPTEWAGGAIPADMITAAPPAVPTMSGSTTAQVKGELVTVTAPKATMADVTFGVDTARYTIADGKNIEGGFVQT